MLVVVVEYWTASLLGWFPFVGLLVVLGVWVLALLATVFVARYFIRQRSYVAAALAVAVAVGSGFVSVSTDWRSVYIDSQFAMHRSHFDKLAEAHNAGAIVDSTQLPFTMRYFSLDGKVHLQTPIEMGKGYTDKPDVLYIPIWRNWRAENGFGLVHFRFSAQPGPRIELMTASGDFGEPVRYLGGGWWVVD